MHDAFSQTLAIFHPWLVQRNIWYLAQTYFELECTSLQQLMVVVANLKNVSSCIPFFLNTYQLRFVRISSFSFISDQISTWRRPSTFFTKSWEWPIFQGKRYQPMDKRGKEEKKHPSNHITFGEEGSYACSRIHYTSIGNRGSAHYEKKYSRSSFLSTAFQDLDKNKLQQQFKTDTRTELHVLWSLDNNLTWTKS